MGAMRARSHSACGAPEARHDRVGGGLVWSELDGRLRAAGMLVASASDETRHGGTARALRCRYRMAALWPAAWPWAWCCWALRAWHVGHLRGLQDRQGR